jgi:hypothetical protein
MGKNLRLRKDYTSTKNTLYTGKKKPQKSYAGTCFDRCIDYTNFDRVGLYFLQTAKEMFTWILSVP